MELLRQISGKVASTPNDPFSSIGNSEIFIRSFAEEQNTSAAKVIHPLRLAISGKTESPGIFELVYILGREKIIRRIDKALTFIEKLER